MGSLPRLVSIGHLLPFQILDNAVQRVEACLPKPAVSLDPNRLFLQPAEAKLAGPYAPDLLGGDEPRLFQDADVLLDAGQGHVKPAGKLGDRGVATSELLQHAAPGGVRQRGERSIQTDPAILNHMVQYLADGSAACKGTLTCRCTPLCRRQSLPCSGP